ncbi:MAG: glycosyltransferase, partial [Clostridiales bacterium]|nr:glycosyltransferase [Clostridiales bacterium]
MQIAIWVLTALTGLYGLHFFVLAALGGFRRHRRYQRRAPQSRIAVVIPARNERAVVGQLVRSLMNQDYPRELYDVFVVPNNCSDDTADVAAEAGATILDCTVPVRSKGEVMRFAVDRLLPGGYDGFVVF